MKENDFEYSEVFIYIPGSDHRSYFFRFLVCYCVIVILNNIFQQISHFRSNFNYRNQVINKITKLKFEKVLNKERLLSWQNIS